MSDFIEQNTVGPNSRPFSQRQPLVALKLRRKFSQLLMLAVSIVASFAVVGKPAQACPICGQPTITLRERLERADVALLVQWVSATPVKGEKSESSSFEVVQVHRDALEKFQVQDEVVLKRYVNAKSGDLFLLMGQKGAKDKDAVNWEPGAPLAVTETSYQYILQAPSSETAGPQRLPYYIKFLEFPDLTIANDAFSQFVNASTKDIAAVAEKLPREKLKSWLANPRTPPTRHAGFGVMLGMCGSPDDARFLAKQIAEVDPDTASVKRTGIDGIIFGYLLLTADKGLDEIAKTRIADASVSDGEALAAIYAINYYASNGLRKVDKARIAAALRPALDRPATVTTVLVDLARYKDWGLQPRLMEMFSRCDPKVDDDNKLRKKIVHFLIACTMDAPKDAAQLPEHVLTARKNLESLRKIDPKLVESSEKDFFLQ